MLINISIDTSTDTQELIQRLAAFLTGTTSLTPARTITESQTYVTGDVSKTDTVTVTEFTEPKLVTIEEPDPSIQVNEPPRRGRPKKAQTSPIIEAVTEAKNDLTQALDNLPGVTELTVTETPVEVPEQEDTPSETVETPVQVPEQEEVTLDLTTEDDNQEEVTVVEVTPEPKSDLPPIEGMDLTEAGAEIRRLVVINKGDWLRDLLGNNKVLRISELTLEQAHKAIAEGRVKAGEA